MNYAEAAYFHNNHCQHVAAWQDQQLAAFRIARCIAQADRRRADAFVPIERRAVSNWDAMQHAA